MIQRGVFEKERSFFLFYFLKFYIEVIDKVDKKEYSSM